jgi:hypothetical protein
MLAVDDALNLIAEHTPASTIEKVPVDMQIIGAVLAEDVEAAESVPAFRASIVDGYAVKFPSSGKFEKGVYPVAMISHAQPGEVKELKDGEIARITTGAPLPPGADAVIMVEDTVVKSQTDDGMEEKEIEILTDEISAGENVREVGSDVKEGDTILKKDEGITVVGGEFGLLASVGAREISIYKRPIVGILSTGDEIIEHTRAPPLRLGEVRDTNRPTLLTAVRSHKFEAIDLGIVSDKYGTLHTLITDTADKLQTWKSRGDPPLRAPQLRRHHHIGRRLHGRARSPQTYDRARARRNHSFRSRQYEARQADYLRQRHGQRQRRHTGDQNHLQSPGQPRVRRSVLPPLRPTRAAPDGGYQTDGASAR